MQRYLREQIDWEQPFPADEYAMRRKRVREALAAAELDALVVTTPANLTWLTGYDMIWYHLECLTGCLIRADRDELVFFDSVAHITMVSTLPEIDEVVYLERANGPTTGNPHVQVIVEACRERGLGTARLGLEMWGYSPHASVMHDLKSGLESRGAKVSDAWILIEELRLYKSEREIAHMRHAAKLADRAMCAARDAIAPGVTETELEAEIVSTLMRSGGGYPGIRTMIGSGPRSGTHHSAASRRAIKPGELVFVDLCASYDRYHVNVNRTFSLGPADARWTDLMERSSRCIDVLVDSVQVGDLMSEVDTRAQDYIDSQDLRQYVWWVGGYTLGIAVPPDWCGNHWLSPRFGLADRPLAPGMVFNLENQFDVWEDWPGGSGCAYIESLLVTETGLEVLSELPRTLVCV